MPDQQGMVPGGFIQKPLDPNTPDHLQGLDVYVKGNLNILGTTLNDAEYNTRWDLTRS